MSTEFFNDQWRIPSNKNQNKVSNYSMDFNAPNDGYIDLGTISSLNAQQNFSISLWFNENARVLNGVLFSSGTGTSNDITINASYGTLKINVGGTRNVNITSYSSNVWYHVVLTVENTTAKVYLDNGSPTTVTVGSNTSSSSGNLAKIGELSFASSYTFDGQIDGVCIFNYALSSSQVTTLYGSSSTGIGNPMSLSPKPVAYYPLGDQDAFNGANYLVPNNSLSDYVFNFDGGNDSIVLSNVVDLGINSSVSVWVNLDNNYAGVLLGAEPYYSHYFIQARYNGFFIRIGDVFISFPLTDNAVTAGNWHHLVVVRSGNSISTYVDNTFIETKTGYGTSVTTKFDTIADRQSISFPLEGKIAQLSAFNTALSTGNIETLYNNGSPANDISSLSPVSWYKLNAADTFDGSDWTINDYGSGGNDGTSSGMDSSNLVVSDLQQTSGYSPYALDFDGANDYLDFNNASANIMTNKNAISISGWFKLNSNTSSTVFSNWWGGTDVQYLLRYNTAAGTGVQWYIYSNSSSTIINTNYFPNVGDWVHVVGVKDPTTSGGQSRVYINGFEYTKNSTDLSVAIANNSRSDQIGVFSIGMLNLMNGSISNVAYWTDTALTQVQVTEIYNQGVPSNLNNFSGTAPDHWLQIGSNSSFNTNWTCLDEIGTSNAVSVNMTNNDIVDGVGYSASGLSSGMGGDEVIGDAPYSTANGISESMDVLDRTTDVPS